MALLPIDIPAGVVKTLSPNSAKGRYTDSDKVRFVNGKPEKWKGWTTLIASPLLGSARGACSWADTSTANTQNLAFGTNLKLYAIRYGNTLLDITPVRSTGTLTNPFSVSSGSSTVSVTHANHGAGVNDFVTFSGASTVGGLNLNNQYQITNVVSANVYQFTAGGNANANVANAGGTVTYNYQINTTGSGSSSGLGWGAGTWNTGTWGTARSSGGVPIYPRIWFLSNYGSLLLALPTQGKLYQWDENTMSSAQTVDNAPSAIAMFVTPERFVMLLGTSTPMTVQWPDQNDFSNYVPSDNNTANSRTLQGGSQLVAGTPLADLISLVWSDTSMFVFQYTGSTYIYENRSQGANCGLIGAMAFAVANQTAYWMSGTNFMMYSGSVAPITNSEDVRQFIFSDIDTSKKYLTFAVFDQANNQIRWHYCSSGQNSPNKYVDVNLSDYSWTVGTLDASAGVVYQPSQGIPVFVDSGGNVMQMGSGFDANGSAMNSYITYGLYSIQNGSVLADVTEFVPDLQRQSGDVTVQLSGYDRPDSTTSLDSVSVTISPGEEIEDFRLEARFFRFTVTSNVVGGDYRLGNVQIDVSPAGAR